MKAVLDKTRGVMGLTELDRAAPRLSCGAPWGSADEDAVLICLETRMETHDVKTAAPEPRRFAFAPGQFLTFEQEIGGETIHRCYTIASPPTHALTVETTIKRALGGPVSNWPHDHRKPGMSLRATVLGDDVTFARHGAGKVPFLSAGSGITPLNRRARGVRLRPGALYAGGARDARRAWPSGGTLSRGKLFLRDADCAGAKRRVDAAAGEQLRPDPPHRVRQNETLRRLPGGCDDSRSRAPRGAAPALVLHQGHVRRLQIEADFRGGRADACRRHSAQEIAAGFALLCSSKPKSDVVVDR